LSLGRVTHLAPGINEFFRTKEIKCSPEQVALVLEYVKELYSQGVEQFAGSGWQSGRHPVTAHSATRCYLQSWFKHNQFPTEPATAKRNATFRCGNVIEVELYLAAVLGGEEISEYQTKAEILQAGWRTNNYIDFIHRSPIDGLRRVVDVKSMGNYGYNKIFEWSKGMDDGFGYLGQMSNYIRWALNEGLVDCDEGLFLCYKKDTGDIDEYAYTMDPALLEKSEAHSQIVQDHTVYVDCAECTEGYIDVETPAGSGTFTQARCLRCVGLPVVSVGASDDNRPARPKEFQVAFGDDIEFRCGYCDYKNSCWTYPYQRVSYDHKGDPVFTKKPQQWLRRRFEKGKPKFSVEKG
jgi:hypothetical protein